MNAIQPKGQPNKTYKVTNQTTSAEIVEGKYPHDGYCPAWEKECNAKPLGRQCGSKQKPPVQSCDTKPKVNHKHHKTSKEVFSISSSTQGDKQDSSSSGDEYVFITTGTDKKKTPKSHIKDWDISDSDLNLLIATTALVPPDTKVFFLWLFYLLQLAGMFVCEAEAKRPNAHSMWKQVKAISC